MENPLSLDLDHILNHTQGLWEEIRGQRLFMTGGTGFFGCWLLESFAAANKTLGLGSSVLVLTRNSEAFRQKAPHLAVNPAISFLEGDVRTFSFPDGAFSHVIHAATDASNSIGGEDPKLVFDTIVQGTRRVLDFSKACGTRKFLFVSSGAACGRQPPQLTHIPEDFPGRPDPADRPSAYGKGKRVAESLCVECGNRSGIEIKIARCFAFLGPYLPPGSNYAVSNFLQDGLKSRPIHVRGDGTPYRSYLYAADLAVWLWTIMMRGKAGAVYNVGSEKAICFADLARITARAFSSDLEIVIDGKSNERTPPERYVPSTEKARSELGLSQEIDLEDALARTIKWNLIQGQ
ncbi:MAG: NAD-dependent epimerase/dehydratase family protein [Deltaproteobacteria bacterium]